MKMIFKLFFISIIILYSPIALASNENSYSLSLTVYTIKDDDNSNTDEETLKNIFQYVPNKNYIIENEHFITNQQSIENLISYKKILYQKTEDNLNLKTKFQITDNKNDTKNIVFYNPLDIKNHINIEDINDKKIIEIQKLENIPDTGTNISFKKISANDDELKAELFIQSIEINKSSILDEELKKRHKKDDDDDDEEQDKHDEENSNQKENKKIELIMTQKNKKIDIVIPYGFKDFFIYNNSNIKYLYELSYQ